MTTKATFEFYCACGFGVSFELTGSEAQTIAQRFREQCEEEHPPAGPHVELTKEQWQRGQGAMADRRSSR